MHSSHPAPNPAGIFQAAIGPFNARDWTTAESLCRQALAADPLHANALHMLGLVLVERGRLNDALAALRQAAAMEPRNALLWANLGLTHYKAGQFAEAVECQRQALALQPNLPEAFYNLSLAHQGLKQYDLALPAAHRAAELRPGNADAQFNLGNLLRREGRLKAAMAAYQAALGLHPEWVEAHINSAAVWHELNEPARALEHFREVLRLRPGFSQVEHSIGHALMALGRVEEAKAAYQRAATGADGDTRYGGPMNRLVRATLAEVVPPDQTAIAQYKRQVIAALLEFAAEPGTFDFSNQHTDKATPDAMLAYYGGNLRPIMEQYAQAIAPQIPGVSLRRRQGGKSRLGIIVTNGHEGTFARCWGGIAERLSRDLFEIRLICSQGGVNHLQSLLRLSPQEYLAVPSAIESAARLIAEQEFDWLHFWEIGTDEMNYYLPFFRLAPGQSTCWGWPVTSGNPYVDSYVSCEFGGTPKPLL